MRALTRPLVDENPILLQVLGVCSALAITRTLENALVMSAAVTAVLVCSNAAVSALRHQVPRSVRLIVQITIIASLVIVVDQILQAFFWEISRQLSVFVGLIITNCIILGRAESFAMQRSVGLSALDGLGNGIGYGLVLITVGSLRELLGSGSLLGVPLLPRAEDGGWFQPVALMLRAPSAFFLIGFLIWGVRAWRFAPSPSSSESAAEAASAGGPA
ncbi:MAG: NADH:ubiquinone reductase (Na(+)-transporting) subunit D [Myxococcales bacterium]|nr:NADH:ubiquinone reductase (Na(+)-transporting) subunit D [Myxococcales bacterium]